jgi:hypothetical protein
MQGLARLGSIWNRSNRYVPIPVSILDQYRDSWNFAKPVYKERGKTPPWLIDLEVILEKKPKRLAHRWEAKKMANLEEMKRGNINLILTLTLMPLACSGRGGGRSDLQGDLQALMKAPTKIVVITLAIDDARAARQGAKEYRNSRTN